jgi:hypothetical protein
MYFNMSWILLIQSCHFLWQIHTIMLYENLLNCVDVVNLNDNMSNNMLDVDLDSEINGNFELTKIHDILKYIFFLIKL